MGRLAPSLRRLGPVWLDGDRDDRPRLVCPLALAGDRGLGLAPDDARDTAGQVQQGPIEEERAGDGAGPAGEVPMAGPRRGVFPKKPERRLECTLLACWEEGYEEPWFLVTDLEPDQAGQPPGPVVANVRRQAPPVGTRAASRAFSRQRTKAPQRDQRPRPLWRGRRRRAAVRDTAWEGSWQLLMEVSFVMRSVRPGVRGGCEMGVNVKHRPRMMVPTKTFWAYNHPGVMMISCGNGKACVVPAPALAPAPVPALALSPVLAALAPVLAPALAPLAH